MRCEVSRQLTGVGDANDEAPAGWADVDLLDEALQFDGADVVEHRRFDARRAQAHGEKAGAQGRKRDPDAKREWPRAADPSKRGADRHEQSRQPQNRFAVGRHIERDAADCGDWNPQKEPLPVDLLRQCGGEQRAPVWRERGGARGPGAGRGAKDAGSRGGCHGRR